MCCKRPPWKSKVPGPPGTEQKWYKTLGVPWFRSNFDPASSLHKQEHFDLDRRQHLGTLSENAADRRSHLPQTLGPKVALPRLASKPEALPRTPARPFAR